MTKTHQKRKLFAGNQVYHFFGIGRRHTDHFFYRHKRAYHLEVHALLSDRPYPFGALEFYPQQRIYF